MKRVHEGMGCELLVDTSLNPTIAKCPMTFNCIFVLQKQNQYILINNNQFVVVTTTSRDDIYDEYLIKNIYLNERNIQSCNLFIRLRLLIIECSIGIIVCFRIFKLDCYLSIL